MGRLPGSNGESVIEAPAVGFLNTEAEVHCARPSIPTSFPENPASLIKETGPTKHYINTDQGLKNQSEALSRAEEAASDADVKFTLQNGQKRSEAEGVSNRSLAPSEIFGGVSIEKDSPESPFEVIIDKATFDQEFKDSYRESTSELGSGVMRTDPEITTDSSQDSSRMLPVRNREERHYPAAALLTRQFSRTTAALEEVSRCVSDMHNFTNEVLTWDLISQVKQPEKSSESIAQASSLDENEYASEIPLSHPKACAHQNIQKIPIHFIHENGPRTESAASYYEKVSPDGIDSAKKVSIEGVGQSVLEGGETLLKFPESQDGKCASSGLEGIIEKVVLPDDLLKVELNGQNSMLLEMIEADSSGESDDTVIEDIATDTSFESDKRESENLLCQATGGVTIQAEKLASDQSIMREADEREMKDKYSQNVSSELCDNFRDSIDDFETLQVQPDGHIESPVNEISHPEIITADSTTKHTELSDDLADILSLQPVKMEQLQLSPGEPSRVLGGDSMRENNSDDSPEDLVVTLLETQTNKVLAEGNAFEAALEKARVKDADNKCIVPNQSTNGNQLQNDFLNQSTPVTSLDLEQEQLTIKALKELGERHDERIKPSQEGVKASMEENFIQTSANMVTSTFAPKSFGPDRSYDSLRDQNVKTASGLDSGITQETTEVEMMSSLSKTEQVNEHFLTRLLTHFSGNPFHKKYNM
ncbi:reticulon-3-like [Sarcophilus harrisii]